MGKRTLGIVIVRDDGHPMDFVTGVILRNWVINLIAGVLGCVAGPLGNLVGLVDALMIFSAENKTLHDRLAGTRVVVAGTSTTDRSA